MHCKQTYKNILNQIHIVKGNIFNKNMEKSFFNQLNPLINGNRMSGKGNNGEWEGRAKVQKKASKKEKGIRSA